MSGGGAGRIVRGFGIHMELWRRRRWSKHHSAAIAAFDSQRGHLRRDAGCTDPYPIFNEEQDPDSIADTNVYADTGRQHRDIEHHLSQCPGHAREKSQKSETSKIR